MCFEKLQWLFPIAVLLHNSEEAITLPGWVSQHAGRPAHKFFLYVGWTALTAAAFAVTYLSERKGPQSIWAYLNFGYIVAMLANVFVPHVAASIAYRAYTPGVATAVAINLPEMSWLAANAVREKWVSGWKAVWFGVGVPIGIAGLIVLLFVAGRVLR